VAKDGPTTARQVNRWGEMGRAWQT
jgi:hypothetical protein